MLKKSIYLTGILFIIFLIIPVTVKADSIIIAGDGSILLMEGDDGVLGISLAANTTASPPPAPKPTNSAPSAPSAPNAPKPAPAPVKQVPITPPNTHSVVQTTTSPTNNSKLQVTINTNPTTPAPKSSTTTPKSPTPPISSRPSSSPLTTSTPVPTNAPATPNSDSTNVINKDVNKVILEGQTNKPVLTISASPNNSTPNASSSATPNPKPNQNSQMVIQQGSTQITTSLPLQIDTASHTISAVLPEGTTKLNVLPSEAVQGIISEKLITNTTNAANLTVSLEENNKLPIYKISGERSGQLLGIFPMKTSSEVSLSAQTGNVVGINQSLVFTLFGFFIR